MRVALYTDADVYAGTESHIFTLAHALRAQNVDVAVACPQPSPLAQKATDANIKVIAVQKAGLIDRPAIRMLAALLRSGQVDILHTHNGRTHLNAAIARKLANRGHVIATQHFVEPSHATQQGPKAWLYKKAHRWVNRCTTHFIAISAITRERMLARGEAPEAKITVIPHGIQSPIIEKPERVLQMRAELQIPLCSPVILCTARLEPEKDVESLVRAMADVIKTFPDVHCLIAGEGTQKGRLTKLISELGLVNSVRLLGFRSDVLSLVCIADTIVLTSLMESFGLTLVEAMAFSKPVVSTKAGGPQEIVIDGVTGLLTPCSDVQALSFSLKNVIADPVMAHKMGNNGRQRFLDCYTVDRMAKATKDLYERVIAS